MIGLVLVTHGRLAEEMRSAMEHVVGPQKGVATVCIGPEDDLEDRRQDIRDKVAEVETGDGVVVLTDMFGGTPSNLAASLLGDRVEVLAGVNMPLPVKLAKVRGSQPLHQAVAYAEAAGRRYMGTASQLCAAVSQTGSQNGAAGVAPIGRGTLAGNPMTGNSMTGNSMTGTAGAAAPGGGTNGTPVNGSHGAPMPALPVQAPSATVVPSKENPQ